MQPWVDLLDYARWAPSPHNTQPWKIKPLSGSEAELYYDPRRLLTVEDAEFRFLFVTVGIFHEYLKIAARARGLDLELQFVTHEITGDADEPPGRCGCCSGSAIARSLPGASGSRLPTS